MTKPIHNLEELEEAAKNRFTAEDSEYTLELTEQDLIPPIVSDWSSRTGGFDRKRNDRSRDYNQDYGKRRDYGRRYDDRGRDDRRSNWDRNNRDYDRYSNRR